MQPVDPTDRSSGTTVSIGRPPRRWLLAAGAGIAGVVIVLGGWLAWRHAAGKPLLVASGPLSKLAGPTTPPTPAQATDALSGSLVDPKLANRRPLAIMVENHPDARPQYGLSNASVVYEAVAEGGITRFMAVFGAQDSGKVGPVRSARTYYLDWALEYDAGYAHVGGNVDALDLIPQLGIHNLDQFAIGSAAFRREAHDGVALEHTMYTDTTKLRSIMDTTFKGDQKWTKPEFKTPADRSIRPAAQTLAIDFSAPQYAVKWAYDPSTNQYLRSLAGAPHLDAGNGQQLHADTIFVQTVAARPTLTRINENGLIMTTVGEGKGFVLEDGQKIEATWKKADHASPTVFYDAANKPIKRNPGVTWFEIVQPTMTVTAS